MTTDPAEKRQRPSIVWPILIIFATIFLMGVAAGYLDAMREAGGNAPPTPVVSGAVLLGGGAAMLFYLRRVGNFWSGWSRRKRLYWGCLFAAVLIGALSVIVARSGTDDLSINAILSGALSPTAAVILAALWVLGLTILIPLYERVIDDHERQAYLRAGLASYYVFIIPIPAWWVLHRAGLAPPIDAMLLFLLAFLVNLVVYLWLKFR
ncbi:hypothetical protein FHR22_000671 [Sphingopyxis panaciterrae]|uniref:hypothetical protein n=1 Tax=Sphingopyxis panaciterrae TaxID=363841 RepID=UPI00141E2F47|nr:hypothetical protein [Sphingopyxis panaciterrae]NIJ36022.1 hypothetical protein [Sphingopyxis panaciterrae]